MKRFLGAALAALAIAPTADAGTYRVYACDAGGSLWDNASWAVEGALPAGIAADRFCPKKGQDIGLRVGGGAQTPDNTQAIFSFRTPAGTTIENFTLTRRLLFDNPDVDNTHRYFAIYVLGAKVFAGAGNYDDAVRDSLNRHGLWYGYPHGNADTRLGTVTLSSFKSLAGYKADATSVSVRIGCFKRGTPCAIGGAGKIRHEVHGAEIVVRDVGAPTASAAATGLLAGGQRNGSDAVTVTASDASGIRRVELLDVSNPAAPVLVGGEEYDPTRPGATLTSTNVGCSWRLAKACPTLTSENVVPTELQPGRRSLVVRVLDAAGNATDLGPYGVDVVTPSNRGPLNGVGAGETGRVTAAFARGRTRTTARYGRRVPISGQVLGPTGVPVAGAEVRVLTRDLHRNGFVDRGSVRTDGAGRFTYRGSATASRLIQFGWRSHVRDTRFAASAYVTLRARAGASLRASRRTVALGQPFVLSGRLFGVRPARSVPLVAQGRVGRGPYRTFRLASTRRGGAFRVGVRFVSPASRGRTITLRVRILPRGGYPYEIGASRTVRVRVR